MSHNGSKVVADANPVRAVQRRPPNAGMGRPKGVPNRVTTDLRAAVHSLINANIDQLQGWIDATARRDPAHAAALMIRLLEFGLPRLARTEVAVPVGVPDVRMMSTAELMAEYQRLTDEEERERAAVKR